VLTSQLSHRGNDDYELLKFKDFQVPLPSNFKTFKALLSSQGLEVLKNNFFQGR